MKTDKDKMEAIGNVVLNLNYYGGVDLYSEGMGEDLLLKLVSEHAEAEYPAVIQNTRSWSVMYHLSNERENICSFLPIKKTDKVLEIGAGCGAVTGCLARLAGHVTCIELSKKRSTINAVRHKMLDNIDIIVGNFEDVEQDIEEKYDYITLIGVLEYAASYIKSRDPYHDILNRVSRHLSENGRLIIAIENQLGLKYFAGCREDHTGGFYEGIEGYRETEGVKTFSKQGLKRLLEESGYKSRFYYPYPDYKLPHTIYSDERLPGMGELNTNIRNFDADRLLTFDESKVFDTLTENGMFGDFANSFLVIANKEGTVPKAGEKLPIYAKFSSERAINLRTATVISQDENGSGREVYKRALNPLANDHVDSIYVNYLALMKEYENTGARPNVCTRPGSSGGMAPVDGGNVGETETVYFEYLTGITLEEYLDELEAKGEYERMLLLLKQYERFISSVCPGEFKISEGFVRLFGEKIEGRYRSAGVSNLDLIFTNIVFDRFKKENGVWNILDYEWTWSFPIPDRFIIYRALFYYIQGHRNSAFLKYLKRRGLDLYAEFGIGMPEKETFRRMEEHFQLGIIGKAASLTVMHELMPTVCADAVEAAGKEFGYKNLRNPMIYYGTGQGFTSDKQICLFADVKGHDVSIKIPIEEDVCELRVDPTEYPCIVKIKKLMTVTGTGLKQPFMRFLTNGYVGGEDMILFDTDDPQLHFMKLPGEARELILEYEVLKLDDEMFASLKELFVRNTESMKKDPSVFDRVLVRTGRREAEVIPEGLRYNKSI